MLKEWKEYREKWEREGNIQVVKEREGKTGNERERGGNIVGGKGRIILMPRVTSIVIYSDDIPSYSVVTKNKTWANEKLLSCRFKTFLSFPLTPIHSLFISLTLSLSLFQSLSPLFTHRFYFYVQFLSLSLSSLYYNPKCHSPQNTVDT